MKLQDARDELVRLIVPESSPLALEAAAEIVATFMAHPDVVLGALGARLETRACTSNKPEHRKTWPHAFTEECNAIPAYYIDSEAT